MKINSIQNNSQNFQGAFTFVNLSKRGRSEGVKSTFRKTTDKFDKQLLSYIHKYLVPELNNRGYASESTINGLNKILNKINITLPSSYGTMIYCNEWKEGMNCFVEIPSKFRINLHSKFTKHPFNERKPLKAQGKFIMQNYNKGGKTTALKETSPEFNEDLVKCIKDIIEKYKNSIPLNKIEDLNSLLKKFKITLPDIKTANNGNANFMAKVDDSSVTFEVFGAFRINLNI